MTMKVGVIFVCPAVNWARFEPLVRRFVSAYTTFPPDYPHELHVICNGGEPTPEILGLFTGLSPIYHTHDNSGWDIGAFQQIAGVIDCNPALFLGTNTHFRRAGWLRRLMTVREQYGPGIYATATSFDICPHIRTNGFLCDPKLVTAATPEKISTLKDRHHFELGPTSLYATAQRQGLPCLLVTWDGVYPPERWRKAQGIYRRGDQSNCLIYDRHHEIFEASTPAQKIRLGKIADGNKFEYYRSAIQARLAGWFK